MQATQILLPDEIRAIIAHLRDKARHTRICRNPVADRHLAIFRMACCCGMRRKEIACTQLRDLTTDGPRPTLKVRKESTKGQAEKRKARIIPLWWDSGTLDDLRAWEQIRLGQGACQDDAFICAMRAGHMGDPLTPAKIAQHWTRILADVLGDARAAQVSIHGGRHSFCSHALARGRSLVEVRDAAGHANVSTTNIYVHALESDVGDLFG